METSGRDGESLCACFVKQRRHVYVPPRIARSKTSIPRVLYMPRNARSKTSILHVIFIHFRRQSLPMTLELSTRQLVHSPFHQPVSCGVVVCAITQIYQSDGCIPHTRTHLMVILTSESQKQRSRVTNTVVAFTSQQAVPSRSIDEPIVDQTHDAPVIMTADILPASMILLQQDCRHSCSRIFRLSKRRITRRR